MLSERAALQFQMMTPKERLRHFEALLDVAMRTLARCSPSHQEQVWKVRRQLDDQSDRAFIDYLRRHP